MPFPVALFLGRALVVLLLAFGQAQVEFCPALTPVQIEWHQGVALAFHGTDQPVQFVPVQQELARAGWVGVDMGRGRGQRRNVGA